MQIIVVAVGVKAYIDKNMTSSLNYLKSLNILNNSYGGRVKVNMFNPTTHRL